MEFLGAESQKSAGLPGIFFILALFAGKFKFKKRMGEQRDPKTFWRAGTLLGEQYFLETIPDPYTRPPVCGKMNENRVQLMLGRIPALGEGGLPAPIETGRTLWAGPCNGGYYD